MHASMRAASQGAALFTYSGGFVPSHALKVVRNFRGQESQRIGCDVAIDTWTDPRQVTAEGEPL